MTEKTAASVQDDLAFMRALTEGGGNAFLRRVGEPYFAAGLCYGIEMLLHGAQFGLGWFQSGPQALAVGFGPTAVFLVVLTWLTIRRRREPVHGTVAKAVGAVFGAVGLTNIVLVAIIGLPALRQHDLRIWFIYPCVVMAFQGMAWLVAYGLRRRGWMGLVGLGWFATSLGMAAAIPSPAWFVAVTGAGILLFMLIPGFLMMRSFRA